MENTTEKDLGFNNTGKLYKPEDKTVNLNKEHPDFAANKEDYSRCRAFVVGGRTIEGREKFLRRHVYESKAQYEIRLWLTKYRNHAEPIVNVFHSAVWEKPPTRDNMDTLLKGYIEDVDRQGTSADEFFENVSLNSATDGISFVMIDDTAITNNAGAPKNRKEANKHDIRPFFKALTS